MAKSPAFSALVWEARIQNSLGNQAIAPLEVALRILESSIEAADGRHIHHVPPKGLSSLPRNSVFSSVSIGLGRSSETSEVATARETERENLSVARAKVPKTRGAQPKKFDQLSDDPLPPYSDRVTRQWVRCCFPDGEASQGPSPVDYNLEIKVDFPKELVLTMQENAAKKARRTVIGRTLGGRATFKTLVDCLKLHLPAPLVSIALLTRGYFEILFEDEEGAKATKCFIAVEWSSLCFSFSRYIPNFDASSQGAETQLTHAIKV
jgi:hypothetical protein